MKPYPFFLIVDDGGQPLLGNGVHIRKNELERDSTERLWGIAKYAKCE